MKTLIKTSLVAAVLMLAGCVYDPYGYVRSDGYYGDAYYGTSGGYGYYDDYSGGYYAPGYYGYGYGYAPYFWGPSFGLGIFYGDHHHDHHHGNWGHGGNSGHGGNWGHSGGSHAHGH